MLNLQDVSAKFESLGRGQIYCKAMAGHEIFVPIYHRAIISLLNQNLTDSSNIVMGFLFAPNPKTISQMKTLLSVLLITTLNSITMRTAHSLMR